MKKIGIVTLNDYVNFGNRLQNYALEKYLNKLNGCVAYNIWKKDILYIFKDIIKRLLPLKKFRRISKFRKFNRNIKTINNEKQIEYYVTGSDQVWNPQWAATNELLLKNKNSKNKISYSASFGIKQLSEEQKEKFKDALKDYKSISVREDSAKKIIDELNLKKEVYVSVDPTMLLSSEEWQTVAKRPKNYNNEKFILNYFLGNISEKRKKEIEKIARENDCIIINLMDKNDKYYVSGPSEFLWLEKNAFLVCTDSFHSSVFAFLFNRPFVVFERDEKINKDMSTRIDTLLSKFDIKGRRFNGQEITTENLTHNYEESYKILEKERRKTKEYFLKALDIK